MQTFFKATTPDGRWVVQVLTKDEVVFDCEVVLDGQNVVEKRITTDRDVMCRWTIRQMKEVTRRSSGVSDDQATAKVGAEEAGEAGAEPGGRPDVRVLHDSESEGRAAGRSALGDSREDAGGGPDSGEEDGAA